MGGFSLIHWVILALLVLLLFGRNRFSTMMGDVAKGLKSFKAGLADDEDSKAPQPPQRPAEPRQIPPTQAPIDITPHAPREADAAPPPPRDDRAQ